MKVLFLGNSHTFVHYVPARAAHFCESHGTSLETTMLTHPGMGLDWHLNQSQTYYNLLCGRYDAVVLQHNAHPFPGKESLLQAGKTLASLAPEKTKVLLYMTWSEKKNPQGQMVMTEAYEALAKETGAALCPVGKVWWQVAAAHPEEELYFADGEHSSVLGASLAGAVIGRTLLGMEVSPEQCYQDAKVLETLELDPRLIDMTMEDGQYKMVPLGSLPG
ncbi:MAG: hypothetical protein ACOYJZ_11195 [Acutalibacter sp.]